MITQSVFAAGGGAVAVGDEHGAGDVDAAGADVAGAGADVAGARAGADVDGAGADVAGAGVTVGAVLAVLGAGAAGLVAAGAAAELADGVLLSATAEPSTTAGPAAAASRDVAVPAGAQAPAGVLEALSMSRRWGAPKSPIPAASATARSPAIAARRPRGFSSKLRYRSASRLR
jgi:hypothetical protein